jgi:hypothetical protein
VGELRWIGHSVGSSKTPYGRKRAFFDCISMNTTKAWTACLAALVLSRGGAHAQYSMYKFVFNGMAYKTNAAGNVAPMPITDQTLLADRAARGGITDLSTVAIVYHINGDFRGDTIDIINVTNGAVLTRQFGLWFGSDNTYLRTAVTNAAQTEIRRVDYVYTTDYSTYTSPPFDHSLGWAFTTKQFVKDSHGNITQTSIYGPIHWSVKPQGTNSTIFCTGTYSLGQAMF